jgi:hypothetical protein
MRETRAIEWPTSRVAARAWPSRRIRDRDHDPGENGRRGAIQNDHGLGYMREYGGGLISGGTAVHNHHVQWNLNCISVRAGSDSFSHACLLSSP